MAAIIANNSSFYRVLMSLLGLLLVSSGIIRHYNRHERSSFGHQKTERTPHVRLVHFTLISELKSRMTGHANVRFVRFLKSTLICGLKTPHCEDIHKYVNKGLTNVANWPMLRTNCLLGPSWHIELIAVIKCKKSENFCPKKSCPLGADLMV